MSKQESVWVQYVREHYEHTAPIQIPACSFFPPVRDWNAPFNAQSTKAICSNVVLIIGIPNNDLFTSQQPRVLRVQHTGEPCIGLGFELQFCSRSSAETVRTWFSLFYRSRRRL